MQKFENPFRCGHCSHNKNKYCPLCRKKVNHGWWSCEYAMFNIDVKYEIACNNSVIEYVTPIYQVTREEAVKKITDLRRTLGLDMITIMFKDRPTLP